MICEEQLQQFTIYICEDIKGHAEKILEICSQLENEYSFTVTVFQSASKLLECLHKLREEQAVFPDLILLDIELPGMDGITLGKEIRQMDKDVYLVFLTAYAEYAVRGYTVNAFRYLLKPLSQEEMRNLLIDIYKERAMQKNILLKTIDGEIMLPLQEIIYISAEDKCTILYTRSRHYVSDKSLKNFEEQLKVSGFFRIHRKYLVNLYHHKGIQMGSVLLSSGYSLPIAKKRMTQYRQKLFHFWGENLI